MARNCAWHTAKFHDRTDIQCQTEEAEPPRPAPEPTASPHLTVR
jgi:hypothetical protein